MTDFLEDFNNGYDGVVEVLTIETDATDCVMRGRSVLRVVRGEGRSAEWFRIRLDFTDLETVQLNKGWLEGGGGVLYDGATLTSRPDSRIATLNLDPGVAWKLTGSLKPLRDSRALISGTCILVVTKL